MYTAVACMQSNVFTKTAHLPFGHATLVRHLLFLRACDDDIYKDIRFVESS